MEASQKTSKEDLPSTTHHTVSGQSSLNDVPLEKNEAGNELEMVATSGYASGMRLFGIVVAVVLTIFLVSRPLSHIFVLY
jgi:hypothetical protein